MTSQAPPRYHRRAAQYALWALVLSQGSPLGGLLLHVLVEGTPARLELAGHLLLYAYMSVATAVVFTTFGYMLGRLADELTRRQRALREANRRLRWLSEVDALTGVLNRRAIRRRLRAELGRAQREGSTTALILLDLDHFKCVNDRFGHAAGDRVLRRVGRCLRQSARASDSVGRIGGEEFLVVLPTTSLREAGRFAERLRRRVARAPLSATVPTITASLGVAVTSSTENPDAGAAMRRADAAMYRAKAEGRDRVCTSAAMVPHVAGEATGRGG
jgi:diguanylate cyclase (GGDEF)-like protein